MSGLLGARMQGRLEFARLSKATLTELSHVLENMILEHDLPATVLTGFQASRNWVSELSRYERLVTPVGRNVAVFASGNLGDTGKVLGFQVAENSRLTQEWFLIVLTDQFSVALFGEDNPDDEPPHEEMDRVFDAAWTFDPALVGEMCEVLLEEVRRDHPDRVAEVAEAIATQPVRVADSRYEQRFNRRVFEAMEEGRRRWRRELIRSEEIHERLQHAHTELIRLERLAAIGTTAATLAHELNNPLATITMTAELMAHQAVSPRFDPHEFQQWANSIVVMAGRAGKMTRGILDLARAHEANLGPLDLASWLTCFVEEMSLSTRRPVSAVCDDHLVVLVDEERLRHILTNLVNNGVQASAPDTPIMVSVGRGRRNAVVSVHDQGQGVPEHIAGTLFEPFTTTRSGDGGTGLGLALSKRFAEDQQCRLELTSTGPDGSVFSLTIPLAEPSTPAASPNAPSTGTAGGSRRVLVVDDDPDVRSLLGHLMRHSGWLVTTVGDSDAAVEAVTDNDFDAVLVDFRLSDGRSAIDVLNQLELSRPGIRERAIVITGSLTRELPAELPPILLKPFSRAELDEALASRVGRRHPTDRSATAESPVVDPIEPVVE